MHLILVQGVPATHCNTLQHTVTHCIYIYVGTYVYVHLIDEYVLYVLWFL